MNITAGYQSTTTIILPALVTTKLQNQHPQHTISQDSRVFINRYTSSRLITLSADNNELTVHFGFSAHFSNSKRVESGALPSSS